MFILSLTPAKTKLLHRTFLRGDEINHLGTGTQLIRRVIDLGLYEDGVPFPVCHRPRIVSWGSSVEILFINLASRREVTPEVCNFLKTTQPANSSISVVCIPPCNVRSHPW